MTGLKRFKAFTLNILPFFDIFEHQGHLASGLWFEFPVLCRYKKLQKNIHPVLKMVKLVMIIDCIIQVCLVFQRFLNSRIVACHQLSTQNLLE